MAIHRGIRIHQYLDDWLVRARSHQVCLQHTQTLVKMCQDLGVASEFGKIRAGTKTGFQLCRLPVRSQVRSGPTHTGLVAEPFLAFGGLVCADRISNCPLDRVLTYKKFNLLIKFAFLF